MGTFATLTIQVSTKLFCTNYVGKCAVQRESKYAA